MTIIYSACLSVMALCIIGCLIYAWKGRRFTDKVVAANLIGTLTINVMCVLACMWQMDFLLDIAFLYALLSLLTVLILCRVVVLHHKGRLRHLFDDHTGENPEEALERLEREEEGHFN